MKYHLKEGKSLTKKELINTQWKCFNLDQIKHLTSICERYNFKQYFNHLFNSTKCYLIVDNNKTDHWYALASLNGNYGKKEMYFDDWFEEERTAEQKWITLDELAKELTGHTYQELLNTQREQIAETISEPKDTSRGINEDTPQTSVGRPESLPSQKPAESIFTKEQVDKFIQFILDKKNKEFDNYKDMKYWGILQEAKVIFNDITIGDKLK